MKSPIDLLLNSVDEWNRWREQNPNFTPDFSNRQIRGADLRRANLSGCIFRATLFVDTDFCEANLSNADFRHATISKCCFCNCQMENVSFVDANIASCKFGHATLKYAQFSRATIDRSTFCESCNKSSTTSKSLDVGLADLSGVDFTHATAFLLVLDGCMITTAIFHGAAFKRSSFRNASLSGSFLTDAMFSKCDFTSATLTHAELRNASFPSTTLYCANLSDVKHFGLIHWNFGTDFYRNSFSDVLNSLDRSLLRRHVEDQYFLNELYECTGPAGRLVFRIWGLTSYHGRSGLLWSAWCAAIVIVFGAVYSANLDWFNQGPSMKWFAPYYFSVVTFTTLGYGDISPHPSSTTAQIVIVAEVVLGYIMLGGLITLFANKMTRRS